MAHGVVEQAQGGLELAGLEQEAAAAAEGDGLTGLEAEGGLEALLGLGGVALGQPDLAQAGEQPRAPGVAHRALALDVLEPLAGAQRRAALGLGVGAAELAVDLVRPEAEPGLGVAAAAAVVARARVQLGQEEEGGRPGLRHDRALQAALELEQAQTSAEDELRPLPSGTRPSTSTQPPTSG